MFSYRLLYFENHFVLSFLQVIIFVKSVQRCMALAQLLVEQNFPAIAIHRAMTQEERYVVLVTLRNEWEFYKFGK